MSHGRNASRFASDGAFAYTPRRFRAIPGAATGAAVAALIPANIRVILIRRWYHTSEHKSHFQSRRWYQASVSFSKPVSKLRDARFSMLPEAPANDQPPSTGITAPLT